MSQKPVAILGVGMTDMSRRDLQPEAMADQAAHTALLDAGIEPEQLSTVVFSNALGGRLCDQACVRGQSWLRKVGLGNAPVVNVDNSCAGGTSALFLGNALARIGDGPVLVLGVEKMWTGTRTATLAGIEDGLPHDYRADMHDRFRPDDNPAGSILMGLNDGWAKTLMARTGTTIEHIAAAAAKASNLASRNPLAQIQTSATIEEVLASQQVAGVLTRLMCSSFTDGAAAVVLSGSLDTAPKDVPRIIGSIGRSGNGLIDYHERMQETAAAAWEQWNFGPGDVDVVEVHDATSAEEIYALESLGFFDPGEAGPATLAGDTTVGGRGITVNPSGGLVGRGHPLGATGIAQVVELSNQFRGRSGDRQVEGARIGVAVNTGGIIEGDAAYVGMHAVKAGAA